jgi:hypothetical protein
MNTPAGWYPDTQDATKLRYWNGQRWTDHTAPAVVDGQPAQLGAQTLVTTPASPVTTVQDAPPVDTGLPLLRRGWVLPTAAGLALVVGIALGAAANGQDVTASPEYKDLDSKLSNAKADASKTASDLRAAQDQLTTIEGDLPAREDALRQGQDQLAAAQAQLTKDQGQLAQDQADVASREKAVGVVEHEIAANTISGDGLYEVGKDMKPGSYRSKGSRACYYAVLNSPDTTDIATNNITDGPAIVTVSSGDYFETQDCADWILEQ